MVRARSPQGPAGARRGHGSKSEAVRQSAILALLSERTITAAAERSGINERTLRRWLDEPAFREEFEHARRVAFEAGMGRVQALAAKAVDTLEVLLHASMPRRSDWGLQRRSPNWGCTMSPS